MGSSIKHKKRSKPLLYKALQKCCNIKFFASIHLITIPFPPLYFENGIIDYFVVDP